MEGNAPSFPRQRGAVGFRVAMAAHCPQELNQSEWLSFADQVWSCLFLPELLLRGPIRVAGCGEALG